MSEVTKSTKKNAFLLQGGILAIAGLLTRLIGMIYRIPLTRIVGSEGMCYYNNAYEIYNIALLVSTYSLPVAVSKLVSDKDSKGEYENSNRIFKCAMVISSSIGLVVSLLIFVFANQLAAFIKWPSAAIPLRFLCPTIFIFSIMGIIRGFFQGKKTMVPTAFSQVIEQIFNAVTSVVAALLFVNANKDNAKLQAVYGAAGGTTGTLVGAVFGLLFLLFIFMINVPYFKRKGSKDVTGVRDSYGLIAKTVFITMVPFILSQTIYQISGILDGYMFGSIMDAKGMEESARATLYESYSNKFKWLYNLPVAIATAFSVSIVPTLSGEYNAGNIERIKDKVAASIKLNMIIAIPSAFGLGFLAKPILVLFFNRPDDVLTPNLMRLGCIAVVFFALSTFSNGILQGINHIQTPVIHSSISLVLHIGIVYLLVGVLDYGIYGMVIGNVTYGLLVCILNWISIGHILNYKQEIKTTFLIPAASSLFMGVLSLGIYKLLYLLIPSNTLATLIAIIVAVISYFFVLLFLKGVSKQELLDFPKGETIVRIATKLNLLD